MNKCLLGLSAAVALFGFCVYASADEGSSDGFPPAQNLTYTDISGADQAINGTAGALADDAWLFIAGSAFTPRTSGQTVTYPGAGCAYANLALTTSLELPDYAMIKGVRLYYYSTSPSKKVDLYLTKYPGDGSHTDLLIGISTTSGSYANEYYELPTPVTVNNFNGALVLIALMDPDTRFCGMRVFYTP